MSMEVLKRVLDSSPLATFDICFQAMDLRYVKSHQGLYDARGNVIFIQDIERHEDEFTRKSHPHIVSVDDPVLASR